MIASPPLTDEADQVLYVLTDIPQTVATVAKRLRMKRPELEQVIAQNYAGLVARGMVLHVAPASDATKAIKLPSLSNGSEPTYYSRISKEPHNGH